MIKNEMVEYDWNNGHEKEKIKLTASDVRTKISTSPTVTDNEINDFMQLCYWKKLNPFIKEAYLVKYGNIKAQLITAKEIFDARADANITFDGEEVTHNYKRGMNLLELWVRVKVFAKGLSHPKADVIVFYSEYVGKKKTGEINHMWRTKPFTMLVKVCKAQAKREAFPKDMAGLYIAGEFDKEDNITEEVIKEVDITPKQEVKAEVVKDDFEEHNLKVVDKKRLEKVKVVEEAEVVKEELPTQADIDAVFPPGFVPATDKQKEMIEKAVKSKYITEKEKEKIMGVKLDLEEAGRIIPWWFGDSDKGIVGERELRELKDKDKPKGKRDELIELIRDTAKIKQIPKDKLKKISGMKTFDTLMGCKIEVLEKVLEYCQKY